MKANTNQELIEELEYAEDRIVQLTKQVEQLETQIKELTVRGTRQYDTYNPHVTIPNGFFINALDEPTPAPNREQRRIQQIQDLVNIGAINYTDAQNLIQGIAVRNRITGDMILP